VRWGLEEVLGDRVGAGGAQELGPRLCQSVCRPALELVAAVCEREPALHDAVGDAHGDASSS
jgi:hypothetical protein